MAKIGLLALLLLGMSGCRPSPGSSAFEVTDSAGIALAVNRIPPDLPVWAAHGEPLLRIGTFDGDPAQQLYQVMDGLVLDDERIAILNAGSYELRFYDPQGRLMGAQGSKGQGPGEYLLPFRLLRLPADSLLVYDIGLARFTVIAPGGSWSRTFTPARSLLNEPMFAGILHDSVAVLHEVLYDFPDTGFDTMYTRVGFVRLDGSGTDSLMFADMRMGRIGQIVGTPHFEPRLSLAADGEGVWIGSGRVPEVTWYDAAGKLMRKVRWEAAPTPVTTDHVARFVEQIVARAGDRAPALRTQYRNTPSADFFPFYAALRVDRQMRLWVQEYDTMLGADTRRWIVFAQDGRAIRRVQLPASFRVLDIDEDRVLGVDIDHLDVERVVLFRLGPRDDA